MWEGWEPRVNHHQPMRLVVVSHHSSFISSLTSAHLSTHLLLQPHYQGGGADLGWPELPLGEVAHYRRAGGWQPRGVGGGCVCLSALKQALTAEYVWRCNKCYDELEKVWLVTRNGDDAWKKIEKNTTGTRGYIKGWTFHLTTFIYKVHALCAICCSLQLLPVIPIVFACRSTPCTITGH